MAKMQDFDWDDLRFLLAAARAGSVKGAAKRLRVNETTAARRIARIEAALGARVFDRLRGGLAPTPDGAALLRRAERIEIDIEEIRDAAAGADGVVAGEVRLTTIPMIANRVLTPALPALFARHPYLRLSLRAEPRNLSLAERETDVAMRFARPRGEAATIARRLCDAPYAVYAARDCAAQDWIAYDDSLADLPHAQWIDAAAAAGGRAPRLRVNDSETALCAVLAELGKTLLPCMIGDADPRLTRLGDGSPVLTRELWLLLHPDLHRLPRIRAAVEWIEATLARVASS
jgi:DNA-binding transcriptional LysR family regulator